MVAWIQSLSLDLKATGLAHKSPYPVFTLILFCQFLLEIVSHIFVFLYQQTSQIDVMTELGVI